MEIRLPDLIPCPARRERERDIGMIGQNVPLLPA
jgi:hypothetical protein